MVMVWEDLMMAHWRVDPEALAGVMPPCFPPDVFDGCAWLGVVPFRMRGVRHRLTPAVPGLSNFPELNLRTYTTVNGRPGVYFFSLDAAHRLAVRVARWRFNLPYFDARIRLSTRADGSSHYQSERTHRGAPPARLEVTYAPCHPDQVPVTPPVGTRADFLTRRYCLYVMNRKGQPTRGEIDHAPWRLQAARASFQSLDMTQLLSNASDEQAPHRKDMKMDRLSIELGGELAQEPDDLVVAAPLKVVAWPPVRI